MNTSATSNLVCASCGTTNRVPVARLGDKPVCARCKAPLMPGKPIDVGEAHFARFIAGTDLPVVVDFWAEWCGPCKMMAPQFAAAAAQLGAVRFAKVDTEAAPSLGARYRVQSIPTLILFNKGAEVARRSGAIAAPELVRWIQSQV